MAMLLVLPSLAYETKAKSPNGPLKSGDIQKAYHLKDVWEQPVG